MKYAVFMCALAAPILIAEEKKVGEENGVTEAIRKKLSCKISLEIKDQPIDEAFGYIRSIAMVGMILDPRIAGKPENKTRITYECKDKPYHEVLDDFCRMTGYKWEIRGKVFITRADVE